MDKICLHSIVSGKVQGVWYRATTKKMANQYGITGWVRNLPDGRVEVLMCGHTQQVQILHEWLWQGPEKAEVSGVNSKEAPWQEHTEFRVL